MKSAFGFLAFFVALSTAIAIAGCGSSSDASPAAVPDASSNADAGSSTPDADVPDAPIDAIADVVEDIEQDPNVYPAKHHPIPQVDNQGGPILDHMQLITVTFTGDARRDTFRAFGHAIVSTNWWHKTIGSFGAVDGIAGPDAELTANAPRTMTDDDFKTYLKAQIVAGNLPTPTPQSLYVIYAPRSLSISLANLGNSCQAFYGYHSSFVIALSGGVTVDAAYALVFDCNSGSLPEMTITASHEIAEAATNPEPFDSPSYVLYTNDAWEQSLGSAGSAGEVGDLCSWMPWTEGSSQVQRIYSNAAAAASKNPCQPYDQLYYGAAPRTKTRLVSGIRMDGHVGVTRGQSVDVVLDCFSEAALPSDFTLSVGAAGTLRPLGGVTMHLSKNKVHNGNGVVLTITVAANATTGDAPFVIRSTLNANDYNDWPVILTVK